MTDNNMARLARDLKLKGLPLTEVARELGINLLALKRLLRPELYNLQETTNDAPITAMRKYLERRRREDTKAA